MSLEASVAAKSAALIPKRTTIDDCSMFEQRTAYCHPDLYHEELLDLDSPFVTKVRCLRQELRARHPPRPARATVKVCSEGAPVNFEQ